MTVTIRITGIQEIVSKLNRIPDCIPTAIQAAAVHVKGKIAPYPTRSRGKYIRTHNLFKHWAIKMRGKLTAIVSNNTPYAVYVQGLRQTWFHAETGWLTTKQVATDEEKAVGDLVRAAIRNVIR